MAQCVRTHIFLYSGSLTQLLDDVEHHHAGEPCASAVEEHDILASPLHINAGAHPAAVVLDCGYRHIIDGHNALLVSLAGYDDEALVAVVVGYAQLHQLRHSQPAAVESLDYGIIALPFKCREVDALLH